MDRLWKAAQSARACADAAAGSSRTAPTEPTPPIDMQAIVDSLLVDRVFRQQLVRLVLEDLDKADFLTLGQLEKRLGELKRPPAPQVHPLARCRECPLGWLNWRLSCLNQRGS